MANFQFLNGILEPAMRRALLHDHLHQQDPRRVISLIEELLTGVLRKKPESTILYETLINPHPFLSVIEPERHQNLISMARETESHATLVWLLSPRAEKFKIVEHAEHLLAMELRDQPLGVRRAMARTASIDLIQRLATDTDPEVIRNLLSNPKVTESTVLSICSARPTSSVPLETILQHSRWNRIYRVRLALLHNPYLDQTLAINLLPFLTVRDLQDVRRDGTLGPTLRSAAGTFLFVIGHP